MLINTEEENITMSSRSGSEKLDVGIITKRLQKEIYTLAKKMCMKVSENFMPSLNLLIMLKILVSWKD